MNNTQYHPKIYEAVYNTLLTSYKEHRIDEAYAFKNDYLSKKYPVTPEQN